MDPAELIVIEPARSGDLAGLLSFLEEVRLPPDGLEGHLSTALVARRGEELVGCAALEVYEGAALLRSVAVLPGLRRLGLGAQLVWSCLDMARRSGAVQVYLLTETAADYFKRFGFEMTERAQVHPAVKQSVEFTEACPEDVQAMVLILPNG